MEHHADIAYVRRLARAAVDAARERVAYTMAAGPERDALLAAGDSAMEQLSAWTIKWRLLPMGSNGFSRYAITAATYTGCVADSSSAAALIEAASFI